MYVTLLALTVFLAQAGAPAAPSAAASAAPGAPSAPANVAPAPAAALAPTLWRFPDENAQALRDAVARAHVPAQLVTAADVNAFLKTVNAPANLGCLADEAKCADADRAMLGTLGLAGRMEATATVEQGNAHVLFLFTPIAAGAEERTVRGEGPTLEAATAAAVAQLQGQATMTVEADPPDVQLTLDGKPLGTGPGPFYISPGDHTVGATKVDRLPAETTITVTPGGTAAVRFRLPLTQTRIRLDFVPDTARVTLDLQPFADHPGVYDIAPGKHEIRFESPGYKAEDQVLEIVAGTAPELRVELKSTEGSFWHRLQSRHPDQAAHMFLAYGDLRATQVLKGGVNAGKGANRVKSTNDTTELAGLDAGLGFRSKFFIADLQLGYLGGGDKIGADVNGASSGYYKNLRRIVIRPEIGARLGFWRFEPYLLAGAALNFEAFDSDTDAIVDRSGKSTATHTSNTFGAIATELGLRFQVSDVLSLGLAGAGEFGPDERSTFSFMVGGGYCFSLGAD